MRCAPTAGCRASRPARRRTASADLALRSLEATPGAPGCRGPGARRQRAALGAELLAARPELSQFERDALAVVTGGRSLRAPRTGAGVRADRRLSPAARPLEASRAPGRARRDHSGRRAGARAALAGARHRSSLRADRRRRKPARVVANPGAPAAAGETVVLVGRVQRHTRFGDSAVTVLVALPARPSGGFAARPGT